MPQTLEETREALFRVGEQAAALRRKLEQHEVIDGALRTILSADRLEGPDADVFRQVFGELSALLRFEHALVMTGDVAHGLSCEAATERDHVGTLCAAGASATRSLRGKVSATSLGHVLAVLNDDSQPLPFDPECPALCAPFTFMGRAGFLLFLRGLGEPPFDRQDIDLGRQIAVLAAQALGIKAAERAAAARTRFLASMSHELRTPLNGIIGIAALLAATPLDSRQHGLVDVIRESGQSLLAVLGGILNYAQLDAGIAHLAPHPVDLGALCSERLAHHAASAAHKGLALELDDASGPTGLVLADAGRIGEVLDHLLGNAVRFTSEGRITLRLSHRVEGGRLVARLAVEDSGPGIAPAERDAIFEPFAQASGALGLRPEGSGLGLPTCRLILREMGSTLTLRPAPMGGSIFAFTLVLPCVTAPAEAFGTLEALTVALICEDPVAADHLEAQLTALDATTCRFGGVPPLQTLRDRVNGDAVIAIDERLLARARATWLMQAQNPGVLVKLPWLIICTNEGGLCGPMTGTLPQIKADAAGSQLLKPCRSAARPMP